MNVFSRLSSQPGWCLLVLGTMVNPKLFLPVTISSCLSGPSAPHRFASQFHTTSGLKACHADSKPPLKYLLVPLRCERLRPLIFKQFVLTSFALANMVVKGLYSVSWLHLMATCGNSFKMPLDVSEIRRIHSTVVKHLWLMVFSSVWHLRLNI